MACELIIDTEIFAAEACRAAEGSGGGSCRSGSDSAAEGHGVSELSLGGACAEVEPEALTDGFSFSGVRKLIS